MRHVPNLLTSLRLLLVPCFLAASVQRQWTLAFAIFVTAAVTDILDGALARRFNVRSRLGAILDPAADKTLMICGFLFYSLYEGLPVIDIPNWLLFVVFVRDVTLVFFAYLLYTRVQITRFPPSVAGKASTVLQATTLATVIAVNGFLPQLEMVAEMLFRVSMIVTLYSGWGYLRRGEKWLEEGVAAEA